MKKLLEKSNYLILLAVVPALIASISAFAWGIAKAFAVVADIVGNIGGDTSYLISLIELMDIFLIAIVLIIFALGMYELFIGKLQLPQWLIISNLHDLKSKLSSVVIMVMGIVFLKHLVQWQDPLGTLFFAIGIAIVSGALIAFGYFGSKTD